MKKHIKNFVFLSIISILIFFGAPALGAQAFGFGNGEEGPDGSAIGASGATGAGAAAGAASAFSGPSLGGEVSFGFLGFPEALLDGDFTNSTVLPAAALNLDATGSKADAHIAIKLDKDLLVNSPEYILDEVWLQMYTGQTIIQGGLMRLTWGRADSLSVLDILNPKNLSDLTLRDEQERKIPIPMLRINQGLGSRLSAEFVYLPWFEGNRIATSGPWVSPQMKTGLDTLTSTLATSLYNNYKASTWAAVYTAAYAQTMTATAGDEATANTTAIAAADAQIASLETSLRSQASQDAAEALANPFYKPQTKAFNYSQAGLRLSGRLSGLDLGLQYFYGRLVQPALDMNPASITAAGGKIPIYYNPYHQIGADLAFVLAGFNLRLEGGINLTEDSAGTDPLVYNRHIVWSAGFDRDLFAGINLNFQSSGKVRLQHDKIDKTATSLDIESSSNLTSTQLAALLSRSFLQDRLKVELLGLLSAENLDYMIEPGLVLSIGDAEVALRGRYFGGDSGGEFGQFNDKSYISLSSKYTF